MLSAGTLLGCLILATYTTTTGTSITGYSVGWFALSLINAGLAQGKNRSGMSWFLVSILLGPFATFMLVAFFPKLPDDS
jgi:hypothetical protein